MDRLLFREWDPIGVYDMGGPDDEYRHSLPDAWKLAISGSPAIRLHRSIRRSAAALTWAAVFSISPANLSKRPG
jgi:hypothetical protein